MTSANKNSFWYLFYNLSRLAVIFFGTMWISRVLGPNSFGHFSYFLSIVIYISSVDSLCHESIIKQYLTQHKDTGLVIGTAALLNFFLTLLAIGSIFIFAYLSAFNAIYFAVFMLFIPGQLFKLTNPIANLFDVRLLSKYSSLSIFIAAVVSILFRIFGVSISSDLRLQSFGYSLQALIYSGALYWFYKKHIESIQWKISFELLKEMIKKSSPIFFSSFIYLSISQSDIFLIQHMLSHREVGIYSIVVKLCEPWVIVSSAMCTSFFPLIFSTGQNLKKQAQYFIRANQLSIYFVAILGLFLCIFINRIVSILLGPSYMEVGSIFRIYFWSILFLFFANIQHIWEVYNSKYSISLYKTTITCILKIILSLILGKQFGLYGFALATLIALFFYGIGFNFFSSATRPFLILQLKAFKLKPSISNYRFFRQRIKKWVNKKKY